MSPKPLAGKSGKRRTKAEVAEIKAAALEEARKEYQATGTGATLRRLHYRVYARHDTTYRNTLRDYQKLSEWLAEMRLGGVMPWHYMRDAVRAPTTWAMWDGLSNYLEGLGDDYFRNVWLDQPGYVEVWCEKAALATHFEGVLSSYGVTLDVGRGFTSWSAVKDTAARYHRISQDGMEITLLAFADFDPSGEDMIRDLRERLAHPGLPSGGVHPEIVKCALHHEDITRYQLPPDFTKTTDPRQAAFVAAHGDVAVELDALDPAVLRERLKAEVEQRMDMDALDQTRRRAREERDRLKGLLESLEDELAADDSIEE